MQKGGINKEKIVILPSETKHDTLRHINPQQMKRILLTLLIAASALISSAQFRWGASVGASFNNLDFKQDLFAVNTGVGGSAGIRGEMMFPGVGFGIDLGLFYEARGAKLNLGEKLIWSSQGYGKESIYTHCIDIPFNLKFKYTRLQGAEDYVAPFVFGGPVFSIQAGHTHCDALKYSGGAVMLTAGAGVEILRDWQIAASYTWGMTYAMKTSLLTDMSARDRTWDLRITYFFKH